MVSVIFCVTIVLVINAIYFRTCVANPELTVFSFNYIRNLMTRLEDFHIYFYYYTNYIATFIYTDVLSAADMLELRGPVDMLELAKDFCLTTDFTIILMILADADILEHQRSADMLELTKVSFYYILHYFIYYYTIDTIYFIDIENSFAFSSSVSIALLCWLECA